MVKVELEPVGEVPSRERLLDIERTNMMMAPGIATATFFRGDSVAAARVLKGRLELIVEANPWLAGTLELQGGTLELCYPETVSTARLDEIFNPTKSKGTPCKKQLLLDSTMDFGQICTAIKGTAAEVAPGSACKNKPFPLLALTVAPDAKGSAGFAVVVSASHVILDGFGYYQLLAMLSGGEIAALSPRRKHEIAADNKVASGAEEAAFVTSAGVMVNAISGLLCGRTPALGNHYVDAGRLAAEKDAALRDGGCDFVSTNDIVLSRFGAAVGARVMLMPINWRGRLANYSASDAGNYEGALAFGPADYAQPACVRRTLSSGPPVYRRGGAGHGAAPLEPLPGGCAAMCCRLGMVSNWTFGHFEEFCIDGCEHVLHVPHCDPAMVPFEFGVLYRPRKGKLALASFTRACSSHAVHEKLPLGEPVRM